MKNTKKAREVAAMKFEALAPLLSTEQDPAKAKALREKIAQDCGLSERTIRRYLAKYREEGFEGLMPQGRSASLHDSAIPAHVLEQAILLRREVPSRSVIQIIHILEWEGIIQAGSIKRSTLQEKLADMGYSTRHMKIYTDSSAAARRFQKLQRNKLWHSDIKYSLYLPIGPGGKKQQVYLVTFIDDATRLVLHGQFYETLDKSIVEDCFRRSIQKHGIPSAVYFDNGKQYRTNNMIRTCAKLGIKLLYARPYSPEATGKVERFNRTVDSFLAEAKLEKPQTLSAINQLFEVWLEGCYQHKPHSALGENTSPYMAYQKDHTPLRFASADQIRDAFLHVEERKVDKTGCISFKGKKYEAGLEYIGCKVEVIYDPSNIETLTVEYKNRPPKTIKELVITSKTGPRPMMPEHQQIIPAENSRYLRGAEKVAKKRIEASIPAVSYGRKRGGD